MKIVFLCSGQGSRMRPLSEDYPKSLIPVCSAFREGQVIPNLQNSVEVLLESNLGSRVDEIVIVASRDQRYFERKDYLKVKSSINVPITEIYNPIIQWNNWYSVRLALSKIINDSSCESVMIVEGDTYLTNNLNLYLPLSLNDSKSYYCCNYRNNEWVFVQNYGTNYYQIVKDGNGLAMAGLSIINGRHEVYRLYQTLCEVNNFEEFWDESLIRMRIPLNLINVEDSIVEFDSISDLIREGLYTPESIAIVLSDNNSFERTSGMTNTSFIINRKGVKCVLRLPGLGTESFINRERERFVQTLVNKTSLSPRSEIYEDGVKITEFIEPCRTSDENDVSQVISLLKEFHKIQVPLDKSLVNLIDEIEDYEKLYDSSLTLIPCNYGTVASVYKSLISSRQHREVVLCHRDLDPRNVLIREDTQEGYLLDFEYSGLLNRYWDYGAHLSEMKLHFGSEMSENEYVDLAQCSSGVSLDPLELLLWRGIVDFVWSCWTIAKISLGEDYESYLNERWKAACRVLEEIGMI